MKIASGVGLKALAMAALLGLGWAHVAPAAHAQGAQFEALKDRPAELTAFLRAMPKGGDLHSHLSGAVYAESYLRWAAADGLCVQTTRLVLVDCSVEPATVPVADVFAGRAPVTLDRMIDALSVRNYEIYDRSGHDQFFATFAAFDRAGDGRGGDMLAEVMTRAADQNIAYLELMMSPGMSAARKLADGLAWSDDLAALRGKLPDAALDPIVARTRTEIDAMEAKARQILGCDVTAATQPPPACDVTVRYLAQVIRIFPAPQVFAQTLFGFRLVQADPRVVGINFVAPEDSPVTLADYDKQMASIAYANTRMPGVPVSLHAGELTLGLVPPEDLRSHIRDAVMVAGARRIGHGVDLLFEDEPYALLAEMARRDVMVEINLTSNDVILGVVGNDHPFETYLAHGVPLALSTDDEGVSRIDLTHEYVRATRTYDLDYATIKRFSRNSLTYAFLAGDSLWVDPRRAQPVAACGFGALGVEEPLARCAAFLAGSEKARLQWKLERDLAAFEEKWRARRR